MTQLGPGALCPCRRNEALVSHLSEGESSLLEQQQGSSSEGRCSRGTGHPLPPPAAPGSVSAPPGWTVIRKESYIPWAFPFPASALLFLICPSKPDLLPTLRRRVLQTHKIFPIEPHLGSTGSLFSAEFIWFICHCPAASLSLLYLPSPFWQIKSSSELVGRDVTCLYVTDIKDLPHCYSQN